MSRSKKARIIGRMAIAAARRHAGNYSMTYGVVEFLRGAAEYAEDGPDELYFRRLYEAMEKAQRKGSFRRAA